MITLIQSSTIRILFVFGRIIVSIIRIRPNSTHPLFGTALQRIVRWHCTYSVRNCCSSLFLNISGLRRSPGERYGVSWKVLEKFWNFSKVTEWEPLILCDELNRNVLILQLVCRCSHRSSSCRLEACGSGTSSTLSFPCCWVALQR